MVGVSPRTINMRASIGSAGVGGTPCIVAPLGVVLEPGGGRTGHGRCYPLRLHYTCPRGARRNDLWRCVGELHELAGSAHWSPLGYRGRVVVLIVVLLRVGFAAAIHWRVSPSRGCLRGRSSKRVRSSSCLHGGHCIALLSSRADLESQAAKVKRVRAEVAHE